MGNGIRVLLVEDEEDQSIPISEALRYNGYEVFQVFNGLDALRESERLHPHVVLLDLLLTKRGKDMDGFEVIKQLRSSPKTNRLGILVRTGHFTDNLSIVRALRTGADDYVGKDLDVAILEARIAALARRINWYNTAYG